MFSCFPVIHGQRWFTYSLFYCSLVTGMKIVASFYCSLSNSRLTDAYFWKRPSAHIFCTDLSFYLWPVNLNKFCQFLSSPISLLRCRLWKQRATSWVSQSAYHVFLDVFCVQRLIVLNRHGKFVKCICLNTFGVRQRLSDVHFYLIKFLFKFLNSWSWTFELQKFHQFILFFCKMGDLM